MSAVFLAAYENTGIFREPENTVGRGLGGIVHAVATKSEKSLGSHNMAVAS